MTTLDSSICWAVLAPLPAAELRRVAEGEWEHDFPYAIDPPPWEAVAGRGQYAALISRSPGSEGGDHHFAEIFSTLAWDKHVYSLWLDPEREQILEWENGRQSASPPEGDPLEFAESLGFEVARREVAASARSVAVVEGASVHDVRRALGDMADEAWIHLTPSPVGVLVTADEGPLGTQAWDIAEALPAATVYYVQKRTTPSEFTVLVLRGSAEIGRLRIPALDNHTQMLADIKGARTSVAITDAIGIPPGIFDND
jgi:hypothetical protein